MQSPLRPAPGRADSAGFALIAVIAASAAIAFIALAIAAGIRSHVRVIAGAGQAVQAELIADGGVEIAIAHILALARRQQPPGASGVRVACRTPDGSALLVEIRDEAGRIDLNLARPELILALLLGSGLAGDAAAALQDAMLDYRDRDDERRLNGAERAEYLAAGKAAGPANAPFASVEELGLVLGMERDLVMRLLPHVTVGSGLEGIDPSRAEPELLDLLRTGIERGGALSRTAGSATAAGALQGLPAGFIETSANRSYVIRSSARLADGALFVREAAIRIVAARDASQQRDGEGTASGLQAASRSPRREPGPAALVTRWSRGAGPPVVPASGLAGAGELPPC